MEQYFASDSVWEMRGKDFQKGSAETIIEQRFGAWKIARDSLYHRTDTARYFSDRNGENCCSAGKGYIGNHTEMILERGVKKMRIIYTEESIDTAFMFYVSSKKEFELPALFH
jgi:hypothetical protein